MDERSTICVFAKAPHADAVKTRLVPAVGHAGATSLAEAFLQDTWSEVSSLPWANPVIASTDPSVASLVSGNPEVWPQGDGDLGARLERILSRALTNSPSAIAIGGDTPGLPLEFLEQAHHALHEADAVIGPSEDGGFYLLGLQQCPRGLLAGISWSQEKTCEETLANLEAAGMQVRLLAPWFDIDRLQDLTKLQTMIVSGELHAPRTREVLLRLWPSKVAKYPMKISVIIPALNERACLPGNVEALKRHGWIHEIIVVDGGSSDGTLAWLREQSGIRLVESAPGRGIQLNAGAKAATGDVLIFLHADTRLPQDAYARLKQALGRPNITGGCFCVRFDAQRPRSLGMVAAGINFRTRFTRTGTGDQAIFVRRAVFGEIGGYPEWPLFEDVEFVSRMKRAGKFVAARSRVTVSARRHIHRGVFRTVILCYLLRLAYWAEISPFTLAKWYAGPKPKANAHTVLPTPPRSSVISNEEDPILNLRRP